jgi:hypothetical protein
LFNDFNCYLYLGYNFDIKKNKNLLKYNSKILNLYQNSQWDDQFDFVDIILPNISFFEKRTYLYINCLGLLKRLNPLFSNNKYTILFTDIEIINFINSIIPYFLKSKKMTKLYNLIPINNLNKYIQICENFSIKSILNLNKSSFMANMIFTIIYKNFYKTNIISFYSVNMNILSYSFFNNNPTFKL